MPQYYASNKAENDEKPLDWEGFSVMKAPLLGGTYRKVSSILLKRRSQADYIFEEYAAQRLTPWQVRFYSESLLANIWLDWNTFVKQVLISSCAGTVTRSGLTIPTRNVVDNSPSRVMYEISRYFKGEKALAGKIHTSIVEPTWANPDKIVDGINGLAPQNSSQLLAAFGTGNITGPTRIQLIRNASAHKTAAMRAEAQRLKSTYDASHFLEPIDILWATAPDSGSLAIYDWIEDLETISDLATQ